MAETRQSLTWTNRSCCGALGLYCLLIDVSCPAAAPAQPLPCAKSQRIEITAQRDWRCLLESKLPATYLIRVDRQRVDVSLALVDALGTSIVKVNSPTLRAGPELLLHAVDPKRQPTLVVATVDRRALGTALQVDIESLPSGSPLSEGLMALTASATVAMDADRDDSKRRLLDLSRAAAQFRTEPSRTRGGSAPAHGVHRLLDARRLAERCDGCADRDENLRAAAGCGHGVASCRDARCVVD